MKIGVAVSGRGHPKLIEKMAVKADEVGYDSFLVTDHFMLSGTNDHPDAWALIPYLAAKTSRLRLGTCVTPLPFRHPAILAKTIAVCDNLSGGRITLGAGFGWYQPEFEAFSKWEGNRDRIAHSKEALELMIRLWEQDTPLDFQGRYVQVKGTVVGPKPVQKPHPPILWGGHQPMSLKTAAQYADGWMPIGPRWFGDDYPHPEAYSKMRAVIDAELKRRGRSRDAFVYTTLINMSDLATVRRDIDEYITAGMNYFTLGEKARDEESVRNIELVAREIGGSL
ncbi:MAG: LLM class flavin-dependent oxidoreductase [Nitrososphaerota archaeon]|nr:LLM class flavin-dependent oxidoreductase [Nitrososphaerota archaeon]